MTDRSTLGSRNRRKGAAAEVALANYLARSGWPLARRAVMTGRFVRGHSVEDPGDVAGTPGLVWSAKNYAAESIERNVDKWLSELDQMSGVGDQLGGLPILVVKRSGKASPEEWWAFLRLRYLHDADCHCADSNASIRLKLGDLVAVLLNAGYGEKS